MIGKISGLLSYKGVDHVLIDVHGIGYEVFLSESTLVKLPINGKRISIYTELIVREDLMQLVGFTTRHEREWYRLLTSVQGVGSKAALRILGTLQISVLSRSILTEDVNVIKSSPGIGPKIAQRIVSELKDKTPALIALGSGPNFEEASIETVQVPNTDRVSKNIAESGDEVIESIEAHESMSSNAQSEALSALTNLGYASYDAALALSNVLVEQDKGMEVQELIKLALQNLSPKV